MFSLRCYIKACNIDFAEPATRPWMYHAVVEIETDIDLIVGNVTTETTEENKYNTRKLMTSR